jgi:TonB-dependent SusC/RagA subfamily outer membrane receptor
MEVLKDASAAAIYGSRAANGVLLITSKKGTTEKPTIRLNMFSGVSDFSYKVKLLTPERYLQKILDYRQVAGLTHDPAQIKSYLQPSELVNYEKGKTIDPWDLVSQNARINSYDLNISGRTNTTNYYVSASLTNEKGLIFNDNQKRLSFRTNIENNLAKWLTIGFNSTYIRRDLSGKEADSPYGVSPYGTAFYEDGEPTQWLVPEDQISNNPIRSALLTSNEEIYNNLFANFYALFTIPQIDGLAYRINYSPNYRWQHNYNFFRQDKYFAGNTTTASKFNREDFDWVIENILTYNHRFNANHAIDATLLYGRNNL